MASSYDQSMGDPVTVANKAAAAIHDECVRVMAELAAGTFKSTRPGFDDWCFIFVKALEDVKRKK